MDLEEHKQHYWGKEEPLGPELKMPPQFNSS